MLAYDKSLFFFLPSSFLVFKMFFCLATSLRMNEPFSDLSVGIALPVNDGTSQIGSLVKLHPDHITTLLSTQ